MTRSRPIIFDGESVRAILGGRKTQARRVVKPQPKGFWGEPNDCIAGGVLQCIVHDPRVNNVGKVSDKYIRCPFGRPGDLLWVQEAFYVQPEIWAEHHDPQPTHYKSDTPAEQVEDYVAKPSIHMPQWASRLTLCVTDVRVERLQEISVADAIAEGCGIDLDDSPIKESARPHFSNRWDRIYGKRAPWDSNPWVWVVEFERVEDL